MTKIWDAVIIGGGLAGYVAALFLAKEDKSVLLVEQASTVGGRAKTDVVRDQFFNLGPHALYKKGKAPTILEEFGIEIKGKSPVLSGLLLEKDNTHTLPLSFQGILSTPYLKAREKIEWVSFMVKILKINTAAIAELSFQQWLEEKVKSEKVRQLIYTMARLTTYSHAPEQTDVTVILTHLQRALGGAIYVDGGWQSIVDQLHNRAVMAGVHIQTGVKAKRITCQENSLYTLHLSKGEAVSAKNVIYTGKPDLLPNILEAEFTEKHHYSKMRSITAAVLDIALTKLSNPENLFALSVDEALYYSVHSPYAKLSRDGKSIVLHVMKYHHPNDKVDRDHVRRELEHFLERLQPGWRSMLITSRYLPQIVVNQRLPQPEDKKIWQQAETSLPGFFTAGDWAFPDSILAEGAVSSGKRAAVELLKKGE